MTSAPQAPAAASRGSRGLLAVLALGALATCAGVVIGEGNPIIAVAPLLAGVMLWGIWKMPVRSTLLAMMFLALAIDSPQERPHAGLWDSPVHSIAELYFTNLHKILHIPPLRFSGLEGLLFLLLGIVAYRKAQGLVVDPPSMPAPRPLRAALLLSFVAVLGLEVYGKLRGGDLKESIWQFRVLLVVPVIAYLFNYCLQGAADLKALFKVVIAAAFIKVAFGAYFYFVVCRALGRIPPYVTTHTDSVLFAVGIMACVAIWWEKPTVRHGLLCAIVIPVIGLGLVLNDRRLAYVTLAAGMLTIYFVSPWNRAKRFVTRVGLLCLPLTIPYAAIGWNSTSGIFAPVRIARSVVSSDTGTVADSSTEFRDMENYNLIATWGKNPFLGSGFGHEYDEVQLLPDISKWMPQYRYLPHNSVLWLWTIGGWVGFSAMWLYLAVTVFFAARTYHLAHAPMQRAALLTAICTVVAYLNQSFGDMGTQGYTCVFLIGASVGLVGKLATTNGVWRDRPVRASAALADEPALTGMPGGSQGAT